MGSYRRASEPSHAAIATSRRAVRPIRLRPARQSGTPDREDPGNDPPRCGKCKSIGQALTFRKDRWSETFTGVLGDPEFIAELNRVRSYRAERLRADVRSLASDAMATLRELISGPDVPPAVWLRASLAILEAANAMKPETIGSRSAQGVKASMDHRALIESLGR